MLHIIPQGDDVFHLAESCGRAVGWIRGAVIRIGAFATERDAFDAAILGDRALEDYLRGGAHRQAHPHEGESDDLASDRVGGIDPVGAVPERDTRLVHDGAYEWVAVGRRPVARLIRPSAPPSCGAAPEAATATGDARVHAPGRAASAGAFALEYVVPTSVSPMTRLVLARVLHRVLTHGELPGPGAAAPGRPDVAPRADAAHRRQGPTGTGTRLGARVVPPTSTRSRTSNVGTSDPADPPPAA